MINKVKQYIEKHNMLKKGDQILVGVSGGADSVCLFHVLLGLLKEYELTLHVVHVNHGIRGEEALRDEAFVRGLCMERNISFTAVHKDIPGLVKSWGMSLEEAGRKARYEVFNQYLTAYKCNKVAIAHNKNDNAETILFNLFRGSALGGLTGISPVRDRIIRPLLCLERREIESFLAENGFPFLNDSSNFTLDYTRNKIRHGILKQAEEINLQAVSHIGAAGEFLREATDFIGKCTASAMERVLVKENESCVLLRTKELEAEDGVIQKELVKTALYHLCGSLKDIEAVHIGAVLGLLSKQAGRRVNLPYKITALREYHHIALTKEKVLKTGGRSAPGTKSPEEALRIPGVTTWEDGALNLAAELINYKKNMIIPQNVYTKWFDYDKIKDTVLIRTRRQGDYLCIDGRGGTKKLKSFFIDEKIPRQERDTLPLLADGAHIIWVIGGRMSEAYKVDENTKRILQIRLTEEKENE